MKRSVDQAAPEKVEKVLTDEGEHGGEDEEHSVAVQGECGGEINGYAGPDEEVVHRGPVEGFQAQLGKHSRLLCCTRWCENVPRRFRRPHLYAHHHQQRRLRQQSEGLVVGDVFAVVSHRVAHGGPRDKVDHQGGVAALNQAEQEVFLIEVHVPLARDVELRVLAAPAVVYILQKHKEVKMSF